MSEEKPEKYQVSSLPFSGVMQDKIIEGFEEVFEAQQVVISGAIIKAIADGIGKFSIGMKIEIHPGERSHQVAVKMTGITGLNGNTKYGTELITVNDPQLKLEA